MNDTTALALSSPISPITWRSLTDGFLSEYRDRTHDIYAYQWKKFAEYAGLNESDPLNYVPDESVVKAYRDKLIRAGKKPATINLAITTVRNYYRYLRSVTRKALRSGQIDAQQATMITLLVEDVMEIKDLKNNSTRIRVATTPDQARELLASIDQTTEEGKRDLAMIALCIGCGLRRIELQRAIRGDIEVNGKVLLKIQQKGHDGKDSFVVVQPAVEKYLRDWLNASPCQYPDQALFPSLAFKSRGSHLTPLAISHIFRVRLDKIGLKDQSTHSLRHAFATIAIQNECDIRDVQQALGHKNLETTEKYIHVNNRLQGNPERIVAEAVFD
jgi:site-specific recombinase XerD